jgi:Arc/MetJ-type ribon-helix-helix transcriptional regulator
MPDRAPRGGRDGGKTGQVALRQTAADLSGSAYESQFGYHNGMTTQIAVRLADETVERLDGLVAAGEAPSRASVIERALAREFRRLIAERDSAILAALGPDPDMDALAEYAAGADLDIE